MPYEDPIKYLNNNNLHKYKFSNSGKLPLKFINFTEGTLVSLTIICAVVFSSSKHYTRIAR